MKLQRLLAIATLSLLVALPVQAKGVPIINTGDEMFTIGPFPETVVQDYPSAKDYQVGYKCSHFGVFWADVWTWDCQMVAVTGENSYADLPEELLTRLSADPKFAFSAAQRSAWNQYGVVLLIVILLGMAAFKLKSKKSAASGEEAAA